MVKLRINPIVAKDLKDIKSFIAEDNLEMALKTVRTIYEKFENIQQFPNIGAELAKRVSFKTDYKYIVWNNYIIIYKITKSHIEIYKVVSRFQDLTRIF